MSSTAADPARNGHASAIEALEASPEAPAYLLGRGFAPDAIHEAGWRVERLGPRCRRYGLSAEAEDVVGWLIPYRHRNGHVRFERLRLIEPADLERFEGGKYRQPAGIRLALYDPYGALDREILDELLIIEGEANAVAVHQALPSWPVIAIPGQSSLTSELAEQIGHVPLVLVWLDRQDPGADSNAARMAERLLAAGVGEVRLLPPAKGMDANDLLRDLGRAQAAARFAAMIDKAQTIDGRDQDEAWPTAPQATLPEFPIDALPAGAAEFVRAIAEAIETPPDLGAVATLGVMSAAALGTHLECGPTWSEEVALYLLVAMESGDRKSTVLNSVAKPLRMIEREARAEAAPAVRERKWRKETLEASKAKLVKTGPGEDPEQQAAELNDIAAQLEQIGDPIPPRLFADNVTPEALGGLLTKHGPMAVVAAEAPIISNLLGRYSEQGAANLDLVCQAYEGEATQVDRRNREELLDRPLLTILLTVQPLVLRKLIENETARQQGLVGRFAFSIPQPLLGRRRHHDAEIPTPVRARWEATVRHIHARRLLPEPTEPNCGSYGSTPQVGDFTTLSLSSPARELLRGLRRDLEPGLGEGGELRPIQDWIARHPGRIARIAALLHLADQDGGLIGAETVHRALRIGEYLLAHASAALTQPDELTRKAVGWLRRHDEPSVTVRDIYRGPLGARGKVDRAYDLATRLVELGALRPRHVESEPGPGRPPSPAYDINPGLRRAAR